jgi:serine/threonine-protein kinase
MEEIKPSYIPIRFGIFEVDVQAGELRRQGYKVKLQEQPFQVLAMLLERPGEVVTREELQKRLWQADTFVDFERGLNRAINKLREALGDDADTPRFVETLPRRGYRFLAPVQTASATEGEPSGRTRLVLIPQDAPQTAASPANVPNLVPGSRQVLPWAVAAAMAVVAVFALWKLWWAPGSVVPRPLLFFDLDVGPDGFSQAAISPDGTRIVFVSNEALVVRRFDQPANTRLAGTEGASLPFFSPNGRWVAFFAAGKLQKIDIEGGAPVVLCDGGPNGGSWGDDDHIVATLDESGGISRIPATGGTPQRLTDPKSDRSGEVMHLFPQALPGGKAVLFTAVNGSRQGSLRLLTLRDRKVKTLVENATRGRYFPGGYLIYYRQGSLLAARVNAQRWEVTSPAVPLVSGVADTDFDVSGSGTLIYLGGSAGNRFVLSWLYPSGRTEPAISQPGSYLTPRLSPDGHRLAVAITRDGKQTLRVYDFARETWTRLTSEAGPELLPAWTRDGEFIAFRSGNSLAWARSDGSGSVQRLSGVSVNAGPSSFSADGKWLAFWPLEPNSDIYIVPAEQAPGSLRLGQPHPLLQYAASKGAPAISPDDRWLAYASSESGRFEIYAVPFSPNTSTVSHKWVISNGGGFSPTWAQNGRELFYLGLDRRVRVVAYTVKGDSLVAEKPRVWSETQLGDLGIFSAFDPAPDGKRVLALCAADDPRAATLVRVLLNVDGELRRRVPAK